MRKIVCVVAILVFALSVGYISFDLYQDHQAAMLVTEMSNRHPDIAVSSYVSEPEYGLFDDQLKKTVKTKDNAVYEEDDDNIVKEVMSIPMIVPGEPELICSEYLCTEALTVSESMQPFCDENSDTAGWLFIDNTQIDNVVTQCDDNSYYLNHDFNKKYSQPGTVFADFRCVVNDYAENQSDNIVLYGHRQKNGTMFGSLYKYHDNLEFYKQNPVFAFSNLYETYYYKIIGIFVVKTKDSFFDEGEILFDYHNYIDFDDEVYTYENFIKNVLVRSEVKAPVDICSEDKFITLSTCTYEFKGARFVVVGRRVRENESLTVNVALAEAN